VNEEIVENVVVGSVEDEYDNFGEWKALWDDQYLYLLVEVVDDELYDDTDGANEHDDGLDIMLDTDNGDEASPDVDGTDDFVLTVEYSSSGECTLSGEKGSFPTLDIEGIIGRCSETAGTADPGYIIEVAIPLANLEISGGAIIGFGLRINDDDDGDTRDSQIAWYMVDAGVWNNPSALGNIELGPEEVSPTEVINTTMNSLPTIYSLAQNFPNPFNPETTIKYQVPVQSYITLKVYNLVGNEVQTLVAGVQPAGTYSVKFNGSKLSSGIYFYRLETNEGVFTRKLTLVK
jgi:hypothetical protein